MAFLKVWTSYLGTFKTPGFGLEAADIPRQGRDSEGSTGTDRITLHRLKNLPGFDAALLERLTALAITSNPNFNAGWMHHSVAQETRHHFLP